MFYLFVTLLYLTSEVASAAESSYKPPNTWGSYPSLRNCAKWCLTGCQGASDECSNPSNPTTCFPRVTGMNDLGCHTVVCLCEGQNFARSMGFIGQCLIGACAMESMELSDEDYTDVVFVLATYCQTNNFGAYTFPPKPHTPKNCSVIAPSSNPTVTPTPTPTPSSGGYNMDQKIALGCGIGLGIPTLILVTLGAYDSTFKLRRKLSTLILPVPSHNAREEGRGHPPPSSPVQSHGELQPTDGSSPQNIPPHSEHDIGLNDLQGSGKDDV